MTDTITSTPPVPPSRPGIDANVKIVAVLVAVVGVLILAAGTVVALTRDSGPGAEEGWRGSLQGPTPRPEFTLTDTEGRPFDFAAETQGQLTLLFFGYTHCPDICPGHLSILSGALEMPGVPQPKVVFVTTDPARDTPERLREWLDNFDDDYIGLTGTVEEVAAAERAAFVADSFPLDEDGNPVATEPDPAAEYEVGHAAQILAYTPDDRSHVAYPFGVRREDWATDLPRLLEEFPAGSATGTEEGGS